jgi:photosystem II stability/assembly factor-like uncharacterized protein
MESITTYLSPNGQTMTQGTGPATCLRVATVEGVLTLSREAQNEPWSISDVSLEECHIGVLLFEPISSKLFAGAHHGGGLWVSEDGEGESWRQLTAGLDHSHIYSLAARTLDNQVTLFLGTAPAALYRSDNLGETWREVSSLQDVPDVDKWTFPPPPHIAHVKSITFHPEQPSTIFTSVEQGGLFRSIDDGQSWIEITSYSHPDDIAYRDIHRLLIHPETPDIFYLASGEGLFRSRDSGDTWDQLSRRGDPMGYPDFLYFDPRDLGVLYMGGSYRNPGYWMEVDKSESSVMQSSDEGENWKMLDNGFPKPVIGAFEAMCLHQWGDKIMLVIGTATGEIYTSDDDGGSWQCIADDIAPVSKDDHHIPFLPPEARKAAMAKRLG